jgi:hypothetical protein
LLAILAPWRALDTASQLLVIDSFCSVALAARTVRKANIRKESSPSVIRCGLGEALSVEVKVDQGIFIVCSCALKSMHWKAGKAGSFNDVWELDTSDPEEYKWKEHTITNPPPARSRHVAVAVRPGCQFFGCRC